MQVLLVSAQQALLSRLVLEAKADPDSLSRFGRLAFGSRAHKYSHSDYLEAAEEMQIDSGLAALEETVLGFLYAHSGNVKLLALLDDITRMLQKVGTGFVQSCLTAVYRSFHYSKYLEQSPVSAFFSIWADCIPICSIALLWCCLS